MSNKFTDSMSNYSTVADANLKYNSAGFNGGVKAVGATYALGNSPQGIQLLNSAIARNLGGNFAHLFGGIRMKIQAGFSAQSFFLGGFGDPAGGGMQIHFGRNISGTLFLSRGGSLGAGNGTILVTSTLTVAIGSIHYYELEVLVDPSVGLANLYVDGTLYATFSGNTRATANSYANIWQMYAGGSGNETWHTDVYVNDNSGTVCNTRLGPVDIMSRKVNAAGSFAQFSRAGVDTGTNDGQLNKTTVSTTSITTDFVVNHRDSFNMEDVPSGTILGARLWGYAQKDGGGSRQMALSVTSGGTDDVGANQNVGGPGYAWYDRDMSIDPHTAALWASLTPLNAAECGYKLTV